jgi:hypothetical protein
VNYEQAMTAIKAQTLAAIRKYDPNFETELVYWDGEPIPEYGEMTCELSLVSTRQEAFREVSTESGDQLNVQPSSLILTTIQLRFESLNNTVNPFAMDLAERTRQDLHAQTRRRSANAAGLAILSVPEAMIVRRREDAHQRSVMYTVFETTWRFEYFISSSEPDTNETIRTVVAQGEGDLDEADFEASRP